VPRASGGGGGTIPPLTLLDDAQQQSLDVPLDAHLSIVGAAGTGKTAALVVRVRHALERLGEGERILVSSPAHGGLAMLSHALRDDALDRRLEIKPLTDVALELLREAQPARHRTIVETSEAAIAFEDAASDLFDGDWAEIEDEGEVDPDVTGLRSPERFRAAALRLIAKLRSARIDVSSFAAACSRGLTTFYGHPPNFFNPSLVMSTPEEHRTSLVVDSRELERQRERELALIKVLVALYERYLESIASSQRLTAMDAIVEASTLPPSLARRYRFIFIDDAEDLSFAELALVESLARGSPEALIAPIAGLTLAGDPQQATRTFSGRNAKALTTAATTVELTRSHRAPKNSTHRAPTQTLEAIHIANEIAAQIAAGTPPGEIAVIARTLPGTELYIEALLMRGIPVDVAGDGNLFDYKAVEDGLSALWSLADPYRHDWLLRSLSAAWINLADASLAALCQEPPDAQELLFELPEEIEPSPSRRRFDRARALRLGRNVLRGDADQTLSEVVRERLQAFRAAHARWEHLERELDLVALAEVILSETVLATSSPGVRGEFEHGLIERLFTHLERFARNHPLASLHDYLLFVERTSKLAEPEYLAPRRSDTVAVMDVDGAKGREFAHVFIVNVRAGAFARYYVPDAFLFYPSLGIVAKENVGEGARCARTAKFSYALHRHTPRERFIGEERRALSCAMTRARESVLLTAFGTPTRGNAAPELLEEIRASLGSQ